MTDTVQCRSCGQPVSPGDRFCPACGGEVTLTDETVVGPGHDVGTMPTQCVKCESPMGRDDGFCSRCGAARPEEATVVSHLSLRNTQAVQLIEATTEEFEVLEQLGSGAMGAVYLAKDLSLGREVAIKVIAPNLLSDNTMISRFRLEAQTVARLRHPNIVNVHAVRQSDDLHYFVMGYIDGPTLRTIVKAHAPLDVDVVKAVVFQVGSALSYAHRTGSVIHRDIKPANIMIDREGDAFVTDFGISKIAEAQTGLTQTGATIGTPEYMSPEQCRGESLTGASDQYALGVVAYEMLCGRTPFSGAQYFIMVAHTNETPTPIRELRPDCPPQVADAVERMLAKAPEDRWPDLDAAVVAMGGAPLGYQDPIRQKIKALMGEPVAEGSGAVSASPAPAGVETTDPADTATSVTVTGLPSALETGERFRLQAEVRGSGEESLSGVRVAWASTDPSIARIDGDFVEGVSPGSVSITASAGDVASSVVVRVTDPVPANLLVKPSQVTMHEGGRIGLSARVTDKRGAELEREVRWTSTDAGVASVSGGGEVVAEGPGTATVTAECEGLSGTARVVVEAPVVETPPVEKPPPVTVGAGAGMGAGPGIGTRDGDDTASGPGGRRGAWAAALVVLVVLGYGGMRVLAGGGDDVGAPPDIVGGSDVPVAAGGADAGQTVAGGGVADGGGGGDDVGGAGGDGSTLDPPNGGQDPSTAAVGGTPGSSGLSGDADPPAATDEPEPVEPAPARDARAASPTPVSAGPPGAGRASAPTPARLEIGLRTTAMRSGTSQSASARVFTAAGESIPPGSYSLSWRSSDPGVLAVDAGTGMARAAREGTAWVVAAAGSVRDSVRVTVRSVVAGVDIGGGDVELDVGSGPRALSATVFDGDGRALDRQTTWTSSDPSVASVDAAGRVTGVGTGVARVTASVDGVADVVVVTVSGGAAAPEPATAAAPPALSEAAVQSAVEGYVGLLSGGDQDGVSRLWTGGADPLSDLLELMDETGFEASVASIAGASLAGGEASVPFEVSASYRTSFGQNRDRDLSFTARFRLEGAEWRLVSCVLR